MSTIHIKICGTTHPEGTLAAAETGADAVELVFYAKSKRAVTAAQARGIVAVLSPLVSVIALFVDERSDIIHKVLHRVLIDVIQLHGDEDDDFCRQSDRPYFKAVRMQPAAGVQAAHAKFPNARVLLFDVYHPTEYGGTGQSFDWTILSEDLDRPWVLAGGLTPEDIADAVRINGAATVGVSGGVKSSAEIKDKEKMVAFVAAARVI